MFLEPFAHIVLCPKHHRFDKAAECRASVVDAVLLVGAPLEVKRRKENRSEGELEVGTNPWLQYSKLLTLGSMQDPEKLCFKKIHDENRTWRVITGELKY